MMQHRRVPQSTDFDDRMLDYRKAAAYVGLSVGYLEKHKHEIGYYAVGRRVLFRLSDLDSWLERQRITKALDVERLVNDVLDEINKEE